MDRASYMCSHRLSLLVDASNGVAAGSEAVAKQPHKHGLPC
jgi:hypothetical protein